MSATRATLVIMRIISRVSSRESVSRTKTCAVICIHKNVCSTETTQYNTTISSQGIAATAQIGNHGPLEITRFVIRSLAKIAVTNLAAGGFRTLPPPSLANRFTTNKHDTFQPQTAFRYASSPSIMYVICNTIRKRSQVETTFTPACRQAVLVA